MARLFKTTSAHEEGGERVFSTETLEFVGESKVREIVVKNRETNEIERLSADLVLIAAGFVGPELEELGLNTAELRTARETLKVDDQWQLHDVGGPSPVYASGDAVRGQSLIVWAIAEGRSAASAIDAHLTPATSRLAAPVTPYMLSW
jgi:glutamate synthase (NADPH/NADH) small chain